MLVTQSNISNREHKKESLPQQKYLGLWRVLLLPETWPARELTEGYNSDCPTAGSLTPGENICLDVFVVGAFNMGC